MGQIVSQLQLGRLPEAAESISEARTLEPSNPDLLINAISAAILSGSSDYEELDATLKSVAPNHPYLTDLQAKEELFDKVVDKYTESAGLV